MLFPLSAPALDGEGGGEEEDENFLSIAKGDARSGGEAERVSIEPAASCSELAKF